MLIYTATQTSNNRLKKHCEDNSLHHRVIYQTKAQQLSHYSAYLLDLKDISIWANNEQSAKIIAKELNTHIIPTPTYTVTYFHQSKRHIRQIQATSVAHAKSQLIEIVEVKKN